MKDSPSIARLLNNLVRKYQKWDQTEKQEKLFRELKEKFTKELVLVVSDFNKNKDKSKYIRLYNKRGFIDRM